MWPFSSSRNFYAELAAEAEIHVAQVVPEAEGESAAACGLWSYGRVLVVHRRAQFPDRCLKTNQPAFGRRLRRTLRWHPPELALSLLGGGLNYLANAAPHIQQATIHIPLCEEWFARRTRRILLAWSGVFLGLLIATAGVVLAMLVRAPWAVSLCILSLPLGAIVSIASALGGAFGSALVSPLRISGDYLCLSGAGPEFLRTLPEWPGPLP